MRGVLAGALAAILLNAAVVAAVVVGVAGRDVPDGLEWIWVAVGPALAAVVGVLSRRRRDLRPWFFGLVAGNAIWFLVVLVRSV